MATRVQEIRECDSGLCRRRKDVASYVIDTSQVVDGERKFTESYTMELCPFHLAMILGNIKNRGVNLKDYPEEVKYNG